MIINNLTKKNENFLVAAKSADVTRY